VFLLASTFVIVNFLVDIVYTYLDPRIRFRWSSPLASPSAAARHATRGFDFDDRLRSPPL